MGVHIHVEVNTELIESSLGNYVKRKHSGKKNTGAANGQQAITRTQQDGNKGKNELGAKG